MNIKLKYHVHFSTFEISADFKLFYRTFIGTFIAKLTAAIGLLCMQVIVARELGVNDFGVFSASFILLNIAGICSRFGSENYLVKYGAVLADTGNKKELRSFFVDTAFFVLKLCLIISLVIHLGMWVIDEYKFLLVILFPALLIFYNLTFLVSYSLKALHKPTLASSLEFGVAAGLTAIALFIIVLFNLVININNVFVLLLVFTLLVGIMGVCIVRKNIEFIAQSDVSRSINEISWSKKNVTRKNFFLSAILIYGNQWIAPILLLLFYSTKELGLYNSAYTITMAIGFFMLVMSAIISPRIANFYEKNDLKGIVQLYQKSTILMTAASLPLLMVFLIFPDFILRIYGPEFQSAQTVLQILALSQFINIVFGATAPVLNMTDNSDQLRNIVSISFTLSLILGVVLVYLFGLLGAAITVLIANLAQNIAAITIIQRKLKIRLFSR